MRLVYAFLGLASAAEVYIPVTCPDSTDYSMTLPGDSSASSDPAVGVNAGDTLVFHIDGATCGVGITHPFVVRLPAAQGGGAWTTPSTSGNVTIVTDANTPAGLEYHCTIHTAMSGPIVVTNGATPAAAPSSVTVDSATTNTLQVSWTEGQQNGCQFASWQVVLSPAGGTGCGSITNRSQTSCTASGLTSNTAYTATVSEVCSNAWANGPSASGQASTLVKPAGAPTSVSTASVAATSLTINWVAGADNDCTFASWLVVISGTGTTPTGCSGLTTRGTQTCTATGLTGGTNYSFDVSAVCQQSPTNSAVTTSAVVQTPINPPTSVSVSNVMPTSLTITWVAPAAQCGTFGSWEVKTSTGASVTGCTGITDRATLSCSATGLMGNMSYTFQVREVCSSPTVSSLYTSAAVTWTPLAIEVNCTAGNTDRFLVNGASNAGVTVSAGTPVWFVVSGCSTQGFVIQYKGAAPTGGWASQLSYSSGDATTGLSGDGTVQLATGASTPGFLTYSSPNNTGMMGYITVVGGTVVKAARPTGLMQVTGTLTSTGVGLQWTAAASNDCVFAAWVVKAGGTTYCNITSMNNATCTVSGLTVATDYTFTVQQTCLNAAANSDASTSLSVTTGGNYGMPVVCQGGGTCNCGNASVCTCQDTAVCNCDHSETCICQLGTCNGGYAKLFTCQSTKCNRQCAETCIGLCTLTNLPGLGRRLMGEACTISGQSALGAPLALLFALALLWK